MRSIAASEAEWLVPAGPAAASVPEHPALKEGEVVEALGALEPIWDELYPAEQTRILRLLIERMKSRLTASQ